MFSSGLFGSCCSQDWDSADCCLRFHTPTFLKGIQLLPAPSEAACAPHTGRGTACSQSQLAQANKLGDEDSFRAGADWESRGWLRLVHCTQRLHVALSRIPFSQLKRGVLCSQLSTGTPALLLQPPPPGVGDGPGRRAQKETCGAEEGPGSASSCHLWAVWLSPLFERRPKPPAISPGAVSCRVCSGPAAAARLPSTHFGAALPGRVWEKRLHPILILRVFRANPSPSRSQLGLAPSRAPGAIWPCHFPHPFLLVPWCKTVHVAGPFAPGEPATLPGRAPCASAGC